MAIYSAEPCWEIEGDATATVGGQGTASVVLGCAFANTAAVVSDILTNRRAYPRISGTGSPRATTIEFTGFGVLGDVTVGSEQLLNYKESRLTVNYSTYSGNGATGVDLVTETIEEQSNGKRLDHKNLKWQSTSEFLVAGEAPVLQQRDLVLAREFIGWNTLPPTLLSFIGKCNAGVYSSSVLGLTFAAETLRFNSPLMSRTIRTDGSEGWNVKLSLTYREATWNKYWNQYANTFDAIVLADVGSTPYQQCTPVDMSSILF